MGFRTGSNSVSDCGQRDAYSTRGLGCRYDRERLCLLVSYPLPDELIEALPQATVFLNRERKVTLHLNVNGRLVADQYVDVVHRIRRLEAESGRASTSEDICIKVTNNQQGEIGGGL